ECLFLGMSLPKGPLHIVDIGSGPGFPGIPTAVIRPDCVVHLVESHRRKAVFLREASRELSNVQVVNSSADVVVPVYDWAVSRAVRPRDVASLGLAPNIALLAT